MCVSVHLCLCVEKKNQLDATERFIAVIIFSTYFGNFYAHHQELETIGVLLPPMVCSDWLLVVGGQVQDSRLCVQKEGCCTTCNIPLPGHIAFIMVNDCVYVTLLPFNGGRKFLSTASICVPDNTESHEIIQQ